MRFVFKTSYDQDINLLKHRGYTWSYGTLLLLALALPGILYGFFEQGTYLTGTITGVFGFAVAGLGLMLATGYTGLVSLGHAVYLGIGAYSYHYFISIGLPFVVAMPLGGLVAGAIGVMFAIPVLRMTGLYLAIATLAFAFIVEHVFSHWTSFTDGFNGKFFEPIDIFGLVLDEEWKFYYFGLFVLLLVILMVNNLLRSPSGRAMIAVRDSETSAQSMGVNVAMTKIKAFGLSAFLTGIGGILFAHKNTYISPDSFNILISIQLLLMIVVGGLGSIHGAILGAAAVMGLQELIAAFKDWVPATLSHQIQGIEFGVFGLLLMFFIIVEPLGLYGMWRKFKLYLDIFPLYRARTFKRQKAYLKTERMR